MFSHRVWMLLAIVAGCDPGLGVADLAPASAWPDARPAAPTFRRLSAAQHARLIHDLFGEDVVVPPATGPDPILVGMVATGVASGGYSPRVVEALEDAALDVAAQVVGDEARRGRIAACDAGAEPDAACRRATLAALARRAWRRPPTDAQIGRLAAVADEATEVLGSGWDGLGYGIAAVLQSPWFLYRIEQVDAAGDVDPFGLASRLSFLLWDAAPDEALLDAAAAGELDHREGVFDAVMRMLDDPRARTGIRARFGDAWGLQELDDLKKDPTVFEMAHPDLGADAKEETLRLVEHVVLDADVDATTLFTTDQTFLNPRLAALYGVPAPAPEGWHLVTLPEEARRQGLLGHASFLAGHAHATSTSATRRGKAVRTRLLCQEIPNPPVDVDTSIPEPSGTTRTLRDRVKEHLESPSCAACHQLMDPIGLGLENYDGIGRWRETDNDARIDASGDLDGVPFDGPLTLGQAVSEHPDVTRCMVDTLVAQALGRLASPAERPWVDVLEDRFDKHDHRIRPLLVELATSPLLRRAGSVEEGE